MPERLQMYMTDSKYYADIIHIAIGAQGVSYVIKHFSHFVKKGAVMLGTRGSASTCATVFQNPDGTRVAVVMNPYDFEKILTVSGKNYNLPPRSFNTIVI